MKKTMRYVERVFSLIVEILIVNSQKNIGFRIV
jgi:hypothetical protein